MNSDRSSSSPKRPGGEAGFTLIESMCAIVILVFGLMAVTNLLLVASTSNVTANQSTAATALASQQLETLKATPFTDPGTATPNAALAAGGDLDVDTPGFFNPPADVAGVGQIQVRWLIVDIDAQTKFIAVRGEGTGALVGARSRAEFTVFRSCTDSTPAPGLSCPVLP